MVTHSFPTRRSTDLDTLAFEAVYQIAWRGARLPASGSLLSTNDIAGRGNYAILRSEEHTSEFHSLMSNSYALFCLKKKVDTYCHSDRATTHILDIQTPYALKSLIHKT